MLLLALSSITYVGFLVDWVDLGSGCGFSAGGG